MPSDQILTITGIKKSFHGVRALDGITINVPKECIFGVIGPNGAGKSTLLNLINGIYRPEAGEIRYKHERLNEMKIFHIARLGISRTFQVPRIFRRLSVKENLLASSIRPAKRSVDVNARIAGLLEFVGLAAKQDQYAYELSGGQQKLLEFARALIADPALLLMDEPFAGVHPEIKERLINNIKQLNRGGKTFVIVSHDMRSVSELCHRLVVLNFCLL